MAVTDAANEYLKEGHSLRDDGFFDEQPDGRIYPWWVTKIELACRRKAVEMAFHSLILIPARP